MKVLNIVVGILIAVTLIAGFINARQHVAQMKAQGAPGIIFPTPNMELYRNR